VTGCGSFIKSCWAIRPWGELVLADPADEEASLGCARQLADSGNRGAALRQLERLERALRRELGVSPGPEVGSLRADLLASDAHESQRRPVKALFGRDAELRRIDRLCLADVRRFTTLISRCIREAGGNVAGRRPT
jgi:DNA-binding SARP family transcriptional activator